MLRRCALGIAVVAALAASWAAAQQNQFAGPKAHDSTGYQREIEKFRAEEVKDLKENWLPLAGLFWLKSGSNRFGTDSSNEFVLPAGSAPARAGVFELQGEQVTVKVEAGVPATIEGQPVTAPVVMQPDISGKPTVLALKALRMHVIRRAERIGIRLKDLNSASVRNFGRLDFYPINPAYRITATWVPGDGKRTITVPNVLGDAQAVPIPGEARFKLNGQKLRLTAIGGEPAKGLFFVFADATSKTETYPAGRFLDSDPVVTGTLVLDFNKAYNPPCAVTAYATCPIAPKENRLPVAITAGEKYDRSKGLH